MALLSLAIVLVALAGCGSEKASLTRAEFVERAETICRLARAERDLVDKNSNVGVFISAIAAQQRRASAGLGKLTPPGSMADDWGQITKGVREFASNLTKLERYAKAKSPKLPSGLTSAAGKAQEQVLKTAKRDGLRECATSDLDGR